MKKQIKLDENQIQCVIAALSCMQASIRSEIDRNTKRLKKHKKENVRNLMTLTLEFQNKQLEERINELESMIEDFWNHQYFLKSHLAVKS